MSKYSDLVAMHTRTWEQSRETRRKYEDFINAVIGGLVNDLEVPLDYQGRSGGQFVKEGGWFEVTFWIKFVLGLPHVPVLSVAFLLFARKEPLGWRVRIHEGPDVLLPDNPPYTRLYVDFLESVSAYLKRDDLLWRLREADGATEIEITFGNP